MEKLKVLKFRVKDRHFAFTTKNVKEILDFSRNVKPVFYGGRALKGLMNLDGDIVSVIDTAFVLGMDEVEAPTILVCKQKGMERSTGMTVSEVMGMEVVELSGVTPVKEKDASYISGFLNEGEGEKGRVVALLDLMTFLDYVGTKVEKIASN